MDKAVVSKSMTLQRLALRSVTGQQKKSLTRTLISQAATIDIVPVSADRCLESNDRNAIDA